MNTISEHNVKYFINNSGMINDNIKILKNNNSNSYKLKDEKILKGQETKEESDDEDIIEMISADQRCKYEIIGQNKKCNI